MKKIIKVYLNDETINQLKRKAEEVGINGRAWLTKYLERLALSDIALLDENVKKFLKALNLK